MSKSTIFVNYGLKEASNYRFLVGPGQFDASFKL
jgi:hypothetical protein